MFHIGETEKIYIFDLWQFCYLLCYYFCIFHGAASDTVEVSDITRIDDQAAYYIVHFQHCN
jgi:hypothetical protein